MAPERVVAAQASPPPARGGLAGPVRFRSGAQGMVTASIETRGTIPSDYCGHSTVEEGTIMTSATATPTADVVEVKAPEPLPRVVKAVEDSGLTIGPAVVRLIDSIVRADQARVENAGVRGARDNNWCGVFGDLMSQAYPDGPLTGHAWRDSDGMDCNNRDADGRDRDGYDERGFDRDGYNRNGRDRDGYDRDGFDRAGLNRAGHDRWGFTREQYTYDSEHHVYVSPDGYEREGFHPVTGLDRDGYNRHGRDRDGYDRDGYDPSGFHKVTGLDKAGYDRDGYHKVTGRNRDGFDRSGRNVAGYDRSGYDRSGYTWQGFDRNGYDRDGYNYSGYDLNGNPRPLPGSETETEAVSE